MADDSQWGGDGPNPSVMNPGPQPTAPSAPSVDDPSKWGGDGMDDGSVQNPGPQPAPEADQTPAGGHNPADDAG